MTSSSNLVTYVLLGYWAILDSLNVNTVMSRFVCNRRLILRLLTSAVRDWKLATTDRSLCGGIQASVTVKLVKLDAVLGPK